MGINVNTISMSALNVPDATSSQKGDAENVSIRGNPVLTSDTGQSANRQQEQTEKVHKPPGHSDFSIAFSTYGRNNQRVSITVTDKETGKIIREIPPEELQQLSAKLDELAGMFIDDTI
ncbi:MAG: flagellar protein FlaG [Deltaproteobacteria bacterium]|nr:flagellar protein FlaG [Deltaproteobacteria bacterium]